MTIFRTPAQTNEARERRMLVLLQMLNNTASRAKRKAIWAEYKALHEQRDAETIRRMEEERGLTR